MGYFKPFSRHGSTGGRDGRQEYLEQGRGPASQVYLEEKTPNRALARDFINIPETRQHDWGDFMDSFRHSMGNDTPWNGKPAVTYQEYVLSPDPKDDLSLEDLRELSCAWAQRWFGDNGRLGTYQVAIIYHDDNASQIKHAHVVVNNTNLNNGRRLHIDNATNTELNLTLQRMCNDRGLRHFSMEDERDINWRKQSKRPISRERTEEAVVSRGKFSWKEELRCYSEVAKRTSRSVEGYLSELSEYGIEVDVRDGDLFYTHPAKPERWRCFGSTLGRDYTLESVSEYYELIEKGYLEIPKDFPETMRERIRDYILETRPEFTVAIDANMTLKAVAACLRTNDRYQITCSADYDARLRDRAIKMQRAPNSELRNRYKREYGQISAAKKTAAKGDFFYGVKARLIETPDFERIEQSAKRVQIQETEKPNTNINTVQVRSQTHEQKHTGHGAR